MPWYPGAFTGVSCVNEGSFAGRAGGILALNINILGLTGSIPVQLRELRTATTINLARNVLTGTIPSCWGAPIQWTNFATSTGFDSCNYLRCVRARCQLLLTSSPRDSVRLALSRRLFCY